MFKNKVVVEQDINTLVTLTDEKTKVFKKNRVIRTLDGIANDVYNIFMERYVMQQESNDDWGRDKFRKDIIDLLEANQTLRAVKNVVPEDVEVAEGEEIEGVVAKVFVQPVDSMEKLYMDIIVA
ncbi:MAG: phage tail sheath C-terminal domain-containing protein [Clostridium neonatale]